MSLPRYLAVVGAADPFGVKRVIEERLHAETEMRCIHAGRALRLYSDVAEPLLLAGGSGAILGPIHRRPPEAAAITQLPEGDSEAMLCSRGSWLIDQAWGDYVAFLEDGRSQETIVLRAPFGVLACLSLGYHGVSLFASDPALLSAATDLSFKPDWARIAAHLASDGLRGSATCLAGIDELLWGERMVVSGTASRRETCWSPWTFTRRGIDPPAAADSLRETAIATIAAQARHAGHVLLMLSGGLDSSILAACLGASGAPFTALNLTTGDSTGDERRYARAVARKVGAELIEAGHDLAQVDVTRSQAAGLARPIARSFAQAARHAKRAAAQTCGARSVWDGGGGDNLFCFLQSVTPVADRLRREGPFPAWQTACEMAALAETSVITVAWRAMVRAYLRSPRWRWPADTRFLSRRAIEMAGSPRHRWLAPPPGALPGSAAHVALLVAVENLLETSDGALPERAPLMAQPLVELCLSIPSWQWCRGGHNRAVARQAFAGMLPGEVTWRRSKGTPDSFVARVFEANREVLADFLGAGALAAQGLLERDAILAALARRGPVTGFEHMRLLRIADVEAWLRSCGE